MDKLVNVEYDLAQEPPKSEPLRQYYFMGKAKEYIKKQSEEAGRALTFCVTTFGCPNV